MMPNKLEKIVRSARAAPVAAIAATTLVGALVAVPMLHAKPTASANPTSATVPLRQSFADLVDQVKPAVVNISTKTMVKSAGPQFKLPPGSPFERQFREFFNQQRRPNQESVGMGSGFIVDPSGYIVTNNHVIDDANEVVVTLHDGSRLDAEVVGRDDKTDLALLKVDPPKPLTAVRFGDSDRARVGDWVLAVGNPFGLGGTVTAGIISARGRDIQSGPFDDFLQVDAPINRGNSGGPLFDDAGNVIGVNTAIFSPSGGSVGIGFAIPAEIAADVVAELKDDGKVDRGWMGVSIQPVSDELAESFGLEEARGALVASVTDGSPAERAGLVPGDVILRFDGEDIEAMRALPRVVARTDAGKTVDMQVWRNGKARNMDLKVGKMPSDDAPTRLSSRSDSNDAESARLGVALSALDAQSKERVGMDATEQGVLVSGVEPDSPAARRGLRPGDVILRVGTEQVSDPKQVSSAVRDAVRKDNKQVVLLVRRDGNERFVAVPFERG